MAALGSFIAAHGLSLVAAEWDYSSLWCLGFLQWLLLSHSRASGVCRLQ